jgi:hypothetical protein
MVKIGDFEFSLREFAGALGDFGPLNPFILGYIVVLGLNPAGIFLAMGLSNLILGLIYRLPLPIEPKKVIGTIALEKKWAPSQIYLSGMLTGIVWLFLTYSKFAKKLAAITPIVIVRGIQLGLVFILLKESLKLMQSNILLAIVSIILIILLFNNRILPSTIAIFSLGLAMVFLSNPDLSLELSFNLPTVFIPTFSDITLGLLAIVLAQIILTFSNAVMATSLAVKERFPKKNITAENLSKNIGFMNIFFPFIGGAPISHAAGGFTSQYFFGARTGGAMVMEGVIEVILALFLAESVTAVFGVFPLSIIGAMLLFASLELGRSVMRLREKQELSLVIMIGAVSLLTNIAVGFFLGLIIYYIMKKSKRHPI